MTLLENIREVILKHKEENENRYWDIDYLKPYNALVIVPIGNLKCNQVVFMGEILFDGKNKNSYFVNLNILYPVKITLSSSNCIIEIDNKKLRKHKIKKLLNK
jgi:hypothetical protein